MSSSDNIKIALSAAFPGTSEKVWKRRSKTKVAGGVERVFENTLTGQNVSTVEASDGTVQVDGVTYKAGLSKAPKAAVAAPAAAVPTSAPKAPKGATAAPVASGTKVERNTMVHNSRWVFNRDVDIMLWCLKQGVDRSNDAEDYELVAAQHIPAGTKFTVIGKFSSGHPVASFKNSDKTITDGVMARVIFDDPSKIKTGDRYSFRRRHGNIGLASWHSGPQFNGTHVTYEMEGHELPYAQINTAISPLEIPYTPVFVLRDSATGELFGGWKDENYVEKFSNYDGTFRTYMGKRSDIGNAKMVTKLSSAKKYATSSAAKASIREFTGYNEGLEEGHEGGAYYIMGGKKVMDLPPTWEMVEFNKVTGEEKRVIEVQNWLKSLNRLRVLTTTHGSAARAAYKKAEAHAEDFPVILIFQNRSVGSAKDWNGGRYSWDEKARFDDWRHGPAAMKAIDEAIKVISGKTLKAKSASAVAVACQSLADAIYAKMSFSFASKDDQAIGITLLDFNTLEEIVETQA